MAFFLPRAEGELMQGDHILVGKRRAALLLDISIRKLDYLIALKELPTIKCGRRVLIPFKALLEFAKRDHP